MPFTLVQLPTELIAWILQHVFGSDRSISVQMVMSEAARDFRQDAAVLRTCRRIYQVGLEILYRHNAFTFGDPGLLTSYVRSVGSNIPRFIRHIRLSIVLFADWVPFIRQGELTRHFPHLARVDIDGNFLLGARPLTLWEAARFARVEFALREHVGPELEIVLFR